jgi:cellulose synthase/poly-beta-1,6-N-acetylglucosamine synthase-like glycosyltransferase
MALIWHVLLIAGLTFLFVNAYLWFLALASFVPERKGKIPSDLRRGARFVIVVPAHNESKVILRTIESLKSLDYPADLREIVVVADNCTDDTARIAVENGVTCLERTDAELRGKGFALDWAFKRLADRPYDAAVIVDADTIVAGDFLALIDRRLSSGEKAIQGYYDVINPESSPMTSLSYLGFVLNRSLRYRGRTRLGGSSNLLGNGMCFTREIIDRYGWPAKSVVEDLEFEILLNLEGTRVAFDSDARIFAEIPNTFEESATQRTRWDLGKFQIRNKYLPELLRRGFGKLKLNCLDRALELLIPPYSILWVLTFTLFALAAAVSWSRGEIDALLIVWSGVIAASVLYVLLGLVVARAGWKIYRNLLYAPFFLLWRVKIITQGYFSKAADKWVKTER